MQLERNSELTSTQQQQQISNGTDCSLFVFFFGLSHAAYTQLLIARSLFEIKASKLKEYKRKRAKEEKELK